MRAADLDIHELLHFAPEGGVITFAGERVLLLDAVALGLLRRELIETLGVTAARAVLTRFGYAHGWRVAETLRNGIPVGQRGRMANRRRAAAYDSGSRPRGGDARLAQRRRARRRRHLARLVRGRAASAASRPGGRAGVLDPDGLRQWLHVLRLRQGDHRHRRSLPGQGRCGLSRRRPLKGGVGSGARDAPAVLPKKACLDSALTQLTDTLKKKERQLQSRRALRQLDPDGACRSCRPRVRRCCGRSIWRGASRRSTPRS